MNGAYSRGDQITVQQTKSSSFHAQTTRRQRYRRLTCAAWCVSMALGSHPSAQPADAPALFQRGINALHQFEYEDANEAFRQARQVDPGFAMAYWGEAMTYNQTLWRNENVQAARQTLARLGSTPAARLAEGGDPQDHALIAAVGVLLAGGGGLTRHREYAAAIR